MDLDSIIMLTKVYKFWYKYAYNKSKIDVKNLNPPDMYGVGDKFNFEAKHTVKLN